MSQNHAYQHQYLTSGQPGGTITHRNGHEAQEQIMKSIMKQQSPGQTSGKISDLQIDQMIQDRLSQKYGQNQQSNVHLKKITRYVGNARRTYEKAGVAGGRALGTSTY